MLGIQQGPFMTYGTSGDKLHLMREVWTGDASCILSFGTPTFFGPPTNAWIAPCHGTMGMGPIRSTEKTPSGISITECG
jgi:hypothetical protein